MCVCVIWCILWYRDDRLTLYPRTTVRTRSRVSCHSIGHVPLTAKRQQPCYVFIVNSTYVIDSTAVFSTEPLTIQNIPEANWFLHRSFFIRIFFNGNQHKICISFCSVFLSCSSQHTFWREGVGCDFESDLTYIHDLFNPLTPNDPCSCRTAPLTSKRCIWYIYSTNIGTEYFKHGIYSPFFSPLFKMLFVS